MLGCPARDPPADPDLPPPMQSKAATVSRYLAELPPDRRAAIRAVRDVVRANLDRDYEEGMQYGMIGWYVPHRVFPAGYHCDPRQPLPFAGLASQKNHMALYLMSVYGEASQERWLRDAFRKAGRRLDMGKCCIRFKKLEDLPLEVIGEAIRRVPAKRYVEHYQRALLAMNKGAAARAAKRTAAAKRAGSAAKPAAGGKSKAARKVGTVGRGSRKASARAATGKAGAKPASARRTRAR
jgi:Domain of unknown function (DU1801)